MRGTKNEGAGLCPLTGATGLAATGLATCLTCVREAPLNTACTHPRSNRDFKPPPNATNARAPSPASLDKQQIAPRDVIKLQTGGTGFAARDGEKATASKHYLLGPGSGRADLRGQHQGPRSAFGLAFNN